LKKNGKNGNPRIASEDFLRADYLTRISGKTQRFQGLCSGHFLTKQLLTFEITAKFFSIE
jgi:hypothetical protein